MWLKDALLWDFKPICPEFGHGTNNLINNFVNPYAAGS